MSDEEIKAKAKMAQAAVSVFAFLKEISLAALAIIAQYFQFKASKAETRANSLETDLTIRDKVDEIKHENKDKTARERIDSFLDKK